MADIYLANVELKAKNTNDEWKRHTQIVRGSAVKQSSGLDFTRELKNDVNDGNDRKNEYDM